MTKTEQLKVLNLNDNDFVQVSFTGSVKFYGNSTNITLLEGMIICREFKAWETITNKVRGIWLSFNYGKPVGTLILHKSEILKCPEHRKAEIEEWFSCTSDMAEEKLKKAEEEVMKKYPSWWRKLWK